MKQYQPEPFEMCSLRVVAQDPSVKNGGKILTTSLSIPAESLEPGPRGARIQIIDYDSHNRTLYRPRKRGIHRDVLGESWTNTDIMDNPEFHAQNVYTIAMATLFRFESSLGRHVSWEFNQSAHQLKIAPHAFMDGNAFYSRADQCLAFGYFKGARNRWIHTCLSHDIVAHETTHALLDGIRPFFDRPSSPDQAAFHEGFSDIVAILSILQVNEVVNFALGPDADKYRGMIESSRFTFDALRKNTLLSLAEQVGAELTQSRHTSLRASLNLPPGDYLDDPDRQEPHSRGEIIVAAVLRAFLKVWVRRLEPIIGHKSRLANKGKVVEEGTRAAGHLLNMVIRALDYMPPTDMMFADYLSALVTADIETYASDEPFHYRKTLIECFAEYGIEPASKNGDEYGQWRPPPSIPRHGFSHAEPMRSDPEAVFRFVWENRRFFNIHPEAFTRILSVRPVTRTGHDGFVVRETVAECLQTLEIKASELGRLGIDKPTDMPDETRLKLYGSNSLVFDEFGNLKYDIGASVASRRQTGRLNSLWDYGHFIRGGRQAGSFAELHRVAIERQIPAKEAW